jgi:hypothetical protein
VAEEPSPDAHHLSVSARERLNFLLERDGAAARREVGVNIELARQAAGGAALAPEAIDRLTQFVGAVPRP